MTVLIDAVPSLSVVIPTYGRPVMLSEAIESALGGNNEDVEVIVVDDHPTIAATRSPWCTSVDKRVRLIRSGPSAGGATAKSIGAAVARGRVIVFLDDDDALCDRASERIRRAFEENPDIDLLYLEVTCFGSESPEIQDAHHKVTESLLKRHGTASSLNGVVPLDAALAESLFERIPISFQRFAIASTAYARLGGFRSDFLLWDNEWSIRASLELRVGFLRGPIYRWRLGEQNLFSKQGRELAQDEDVVTYLKSIARNTKIQESPRLAQKLKIALSNSLYQLARCYIVRGQVMRGISTLIESQSQFHVLRRWLTLVRLVLRES